MAKLLQLRRGTALQIAGLTPALAELWFDTDNRRITVGDGATSGGLTIARMAEITRVSVRACAINLNILGDNPVTVALPVGITRYKVVGVTVAHASAIPNLAKIGLYTGSNCSGVTIVTPHLLDGITSAAENTSGNSMEMTVNNSANTTYTINQLYINIGTINGSALVVDVAIILELVS